MRGGGLEPPSLAACAPQTHAYTNSATRAKNDLQRGKCYLDILAKILRYSKIYFSLSW